ncbi:hypothetical protein VTK73DRAFT_3225 [Phialemonium thermophilum]|uniref:Pt repeat family protein n=1 Tax=Phialemonium thermophilum TaxID=223376 RepID=A0ABR3Y7G5_9PEZI
MAWDSQHRGSRLRLWGKNVTPPDDDVRLQLYGRHCSAGNSNVGVTADPDKEVPSVMSSFSEVEHALQPGLQPLLVKVYVHFTDPIIRSKYTRTYACSSCFQPSDRICDGLIRRIEHCCHELITRKDPEALKPSSAPSGHSKPMRFEMGFHIIRRDTGQWTERSFRSFQRQPLTIDSAKDVIFSTQRILGLFLLRHDPGFKWLDGPVGESYPSASETTIHHLHRPVSTACIPRLRFLDAAQSFESKPGYRIELSLETRHCQSRDVVSQKHTLKIDSKQTAPLNLVCAEDLLWDAAQSVHVALEAKKHDFDSQHATCNGFEGPSACEHLVEDAVHIGLHVVNNLGPSHPHLKREFQSNLALFCNGDDQDGRYFLANLKDQLLRVRDRADERINAMDDFELRILEFRCSGSTLHNPAQFRLGPSVSYSRRSIEAVLDRVQTGIADVLHDRGAAAHITAYKRGHLVFDKALVARREAFVPLRGESQKYELLASLRARIQQDIDMVCKDTCSIDDMPEPMSSSTEYTAGMAQASSRTDHTQRLREGWYPIVIRTRPAPATEQLDLASSDQIQRRFTLACDPTPSSKDLQAQGRPWPLRTGDTLRPRSFPLFPAIPKRSSSINWAKAISPPANKNNTPLLNSCRGVQTPPRISLSEASNHVELQAPQSALLKVSGGSIQPEEPSPVTGFEEIPKHSAVERIVAGAALLSERARASELPKAESDLQEPTQPSEQLSRSSNQLLDVALDEGPGPEPASLELERDSTQDFPESTLESDSEGLDEPKPNEDVADTHATASEDEVCPAERDSTIPVRDGLIIAGPTQPFSPGDKMDVSPELLPDRKRSADQMTTYPDESKELAPSSLTKGKSLQNTDNEVAGAFEEIASIGEAGVLDQTPTGQRSTTEDGETEGTGSFVTAHELGTTQHVLTPERSGHVEAFSTMLQFIHGQYDDCDEEEESLRFLTASEEFSRSRIDLEEAIDNFSGDKCPATPTVFSVENEVDRQDTAVTPKSAEHSEAYYDNEIHRSTPDLSSDGGSSPRDSAIVTPLSITTLQLGKRTSISIEAVVCAGSLEEPGLQSAPGFQSCELDPSEIPRDEASTANFQTQGMNCGTGGILPDMGEGVCLECGSQKPYQGIEPSRVLSSMQLWHCDQPDVADLSLEKEPMDHTVTGGLSKGSSFSQMDDGACMNTEAGGPGSPFPLNEPEKEDETLPSPELRRVVPDSCADIAPPPIGEALDPGAPKMEEQYTEFAGTEIDSHEEKVDASLLCELATAIEGRQEDTDLAANAPVALECATPEDIAEPVVNSKLEEAPFKDEDHLEVPLDTQTNAVPSTAMEESYTDTSSNVASEPKTSTACPTFDTLRSLIPLSITGASLSSPQADRAPASKPVVVINGKGSVDDLVSTSAALVASEGRHQPKEYLHATAGYLGLHETRLVDVGLRGALGGPHRQRSASVLGNQRARTGGNSSPAGQEVNEGDSIAFSSVSTSTSTTKETAKDDENMGLKNTRQDAGETLMGNTGLSRLMMLFAGVTAAGKLLSDSKSP